MDEHVLYAARLCGIDTAYKIGGAQAIAAMAYGTQSVTKVDKIYGPGNSWVTQAKILVSQDPAGASCDLPAGPTEQMLIADHEANPKFIAADLLSQAEHGIDSHVILICDDVEVAKQVNEQLKIQLTTLPRANIAEQALQNGCTILVENLTEAIAIANQYAPEHLLLQMQNPRRYIQQIKAAGSVFLGAWSPESVGDYASGTNHVLPTFGYGRSYSGLTLLDFMRRISFQELTQQGLKNMSETVTTLAAIEGLEAHKRAVEIRFAENVARSLLRDVENHG
jgi:histidinol dehydrogenase